MTFFFTTIFLFMVFWRPQEWLVPGLYGWPILDVVVGFALLGLAVEVNEGRVKIPRDIPQTYLLFGLWVSAPLSHIAHTYFAGMMESISPVFNMCFFSFLFIVTLDRPERLRLVARLFVAMALLLAFHAQLQMKRGYGLGHIYPIWVPSIEGAPEYYRAQFIGIFSDPNDLAQILVTCIPFTFALGRRFNFFSVVIGCLLSWFLYDSMLTTHSRGGMMGLFAVIGCQVALWFPARMFPYLFVTGLIGFLGMCSFSGSGMDQSAQDRVVFWGLANEMFKHNPIFGIGYEMAWMCTTKGQALHNAFVTCYTELGLFGYWFWFLLIQLGVIGGLRVRAALRRVDDIEARNLRFMAGQTIVAIVGFGTSAYFLSRTFIYPLFFLMAMLAAMPRLARAYLPPHHPRLFNNRRDIYIRGTIGVLISVLFIYLSIVLLNKSYYG